METIRFFEADIVAVVNNEPLIQQMKEYIQTNKILKNTPEFVSLRRSDSVIVRSREARRKKRDGCVQEYFYGEYNTLHPFTRVIPFSDIRLYQTASSDGKLEVSKIAPATLTPGTILALMQTESAEKIVTACVAGYFMVCEKPDLSRKTVTLLSPCPGALPSQFFLKSSFQASLQAA